MSLNRPDRPRPAWLRLLLAAVTVFVFLFGGLALLPSVSPDASAALADQLRAWVGPEPVAELESLSFQLQDAANQIRYQLSGTPPQLSWAGTPGPLEDSVSTQITPEAASVDAKATPGPTDQVSTTPTPEPSVDDLRQEESKHPGAAVAAPLIPTPTLAPVQNLPSAPIAIVWQNFGPVFSGRFVLARAGIQPDPWRPYAQVALVRIDLSQTLLHLVPGSVEPAAAPGVPPFARPGNIPSDQQSSGYLVAGFNGGFKAINGGYGMMVNGIMILPPRNGLATVALYRDGSVRIGAWGRDLALTPDVVAYRQNCPLLVDAGAINPSVRDENRWEWGYTVRNLDTTWRSGLGLTRDGHYLIYAAGTFLTVESLARSLQAAGAYYAMQLDINANYTRFVTYRVIAPNTMIADKLLSQMAGTGTQFLVSDPRDFFYVTLRH